MKYYICVNDELKEVTTEEHSEWETNDPKSFLFPDYTKTIGDRIYTVQTMFEGDLQDEDEIRPFVIEFLEDSSSQVVEEFETGDLFDDDFIEYCATLEEFRKRYREIIDMIEKKSMKAGT